MHIFELKWNPFITNITSKNCKQAYENKEVGAFTTYTFICIYFFIFVCLFRILRCFICE